MIWEFIKFYMLGWLKWILGYLKIRKTCKNVKIGFGTSVNDSILRKYVTVYQNVMISKCNIGKYTYIASDSKFSNTSIGSFCSIGPGIRCGMGMHPSSSFVSTHPIFFSTSQQSQICFADKSYFEELKPIQIGNDVWIGANATILDGVNIGDGAIIAAGAVVNKDVPPYAIVGGVPAKIIRYRFEQGQIEFLLQDEWWNKSDRWLQNNYKSMHDIDNYMKENGK